MSTRRRDSARTQSQGSPPGRRRTIRWTDRARNDLTEIGDFIAIGNVAAAAHWAEMFIKAVERASAFPLNGRVVPEIDRDDQEPLVAGIGASRSGARDGRIFPFGQSVHSQAESHG